jgi:hypothetical protein
MKGVMKEKVALVIVGLAVGALFCPAAIKACGVSGGASEITINASGADTVVLTPGYPNAYADPSCVDYDFAQVKDTLTKVTISGGTMDEIRAALIIYTTRIHKYGGGNVLANQIDLVLVPSDDVVLTDNDLNYIHGYMATLSQFGSKDPKVTIEAAGNVDLSQIVSLPTSDNLVVSGNGVITIPSGQTPQTYFGSQVKTDAGVIIKDNGGSNSWSAQDAGTFTPTPVSSSGSGGGGGGGITPAKNPGCGDSTPVGLADLFQIERKGTSATLYFTPVNDGTNRYHVVFGHSEGEELYGQLSAEVTRETNNGVQMVTINNLSAGAKYAFQVMPVNGCAVGLRSNWLSSLRAGISYRYK